MREERTTMPEESKIYYTEEDREAVLEASQLLETLGTEQAMYLAGRLAGLAGRVDVGQET